MVLLTTSQWIIIIIGFISLIPTIILLRQYLKTFVTDFLLFSGIFLSVTIAAFSQIFADGTNILLFFQLQYWALVCTFLFFFLHGSRILWKRTPIIIWFIGISWFVLLTVLICFYKIMPQEETAFVLFMEMPAIAGSYYPKGAGIETNSGVILHSTSYTFLSTLYSLYSTGILLYAYITIKPQYPSQKVVLAKKMWIIVASLIFVYSLCGIPWIYNYFNSIMAMNFNFSLVFVLIAEIMCACIAIFIPESLLISHVQLMRAHKLYEKVQGLKSSEEIARFGMETLVEYLKSIPIQLMTEIETSK